MKEWRDRRNPGRCPLHLPLIRGLALVLLLDSLHLVLEQTFGTNLRPDLEATLTRTIWMRFFVAVLMFLVGSALYCPASRGQAALLLEEPYGVFGSVNPTGHNAIYFARICAQSPTELRRCQPGETGAVISRYQGISGYDWVAIPLIPYLYAVEDSAEAPARADRRTVDSLRSRYHEQHLMSLGEHLSPGGFVHGGWKQLIGVSYERRIYAFRFETTEAEDNALIRKLNESPNKTRFNLFYNNCSDFARRLLNQYFPGTFRRSIFPDAGVTTPKQLAYKLVRYSRKHPETRLEVMEIEQIPGLRRSSSRAKSISESLTTTVWAIPIVILNPYLSGGILADYLIHGRFHPVPKNAPRLGPEDLAALTGIEANEQNQRQAMMTAKAADDTALATTFTNLSFQESGDEDE